MTDDPDRLTYQEAADRCAVSLRTIEQAVKDRKLDPRPWRSPTGGQRRMVLLTQDVEQWAQARAGGPPTPFLVPPTAGPTNGNGHQAGTALARSPDALPSMEDVLRAVVAIARQLGTPEAPQEVPQAPQGPQGPQLFVTIAEAAALTGLPQAYLRRRCQAGWSGAIKSGAWRIRRNDLEQL